MKHTQVGDNLQTLTEDQFNLLKVIKNEYEQGMLALNSLGAHTLTVYGGSMVQPTDMAYEKVMEITEILARKGWGIASGGGPGIMTAALDGAQKGGGKAIAFCIDIPGEPPAPNIDISLVFSQFSVRKYILRQSDAFIFAPGGLGTLDELMELLTLIKTNKYPSKPVFLLDSRFWAGYMKWFEEILYNERKVIAQDFLKLFTLVDEPNQILDIIYKK
jgi:uncharacterized protein (TIGR00730 family)